MKNMRVLIDTNIVLDWLMSREPFQKNARFIMEKCLFGDLEGYLTVHSLTDLFYILRKDFDVEKRKRLILLLCDNINIIAEDREAVKSALEHENWKDLEDGLQMQGALQEKLDYIVTRNIKDFKSSIILPVLPEQLIELYKAQYEN